MNSQFHRKSELVLLDSSPLPSAPRLRVPSVVSERFAVLVQSGKLTSTVRTFRRFPRILCFHQVWIPRCHRFRLCWPQHHSTRRCFRARHCVRRDHLSCSLNFSIDFPRFFSVRLTAARDIILGLLMRDSTAAVVTRAVRKSSFPRRCGRILLTLFFFPFDRG